MKPEIRAKFSQYSAAVQKQLEAVRCLIFAVAEDAKLGKVEETLKWGEVSYLVKGGSTIRIDWKPKDPEVIKVYFNCQTRLIETFREIYRDEFEYEGRRAIAIPLTTDVQQGPLGANGNAIP